MALEKIGELQEKLERKYRKRERGYPMLNPMLKSNAKMLPRSPKPPA